MNEVTVRTDRPQYDYAQYSLSQRPISSALARVYRMCSDLPQGSSVLDAGCGDGHFGICALRPRSFRVVGVDVSVTAIQKYQVAICEQGLPDVAIQADLANGPVNLSHHEMFWSAVSWRVLHALSAHDQRKVCKTVCRVLPSGTSFHVAVLSDQDWKRNALRGSYVEGQLNDCSRVMGLDKPWPLYFFNEESLRRLANDTGFRFHGLSTFQEETGFKHLVTAGRPTIDYIYARFVKT